MTFRIAFLPLVLGSGQAISLSQPAIIPAPKNEVRGAWVATTAGLDWPRSLDTAEQISSLRAIVSSLKAAHFNTVFFQVRARGNAYYRSRYEPWAENLTGTLGKDPGWDPLGLLLTEAHRVGLEVHAWFNLYKIRGPRPASPSIPEHPSRVYPRWVVDHEGELWLDPGVPEVRDYLLRVALDLVRSYDIDGITFDFIRYPARDFPDDETYRRYGQGLSREGWRRANINRFVTIFYDSATASKPMLKVGSAPLGIYDNMNRGDLLGSYDAVYQDSEGWILERKHDYLVPQVYWNIGSSPGDPDFALLVEQWQQQANERHIYIGIGAYKPEIAKEVATQIDVTRRYKAAGQAYFRYENIRNEGIFGARYRTLANIPPMKWKDPVPPLAPGDLTVTEIKPDVFHLQWIPGEKAADGDRARYYNIYRWTTEDIPFNDPSAIAAITSADTTAFLDTVVSPAGLKLFYAVSAFDKAHNEGPPSNVATVVVKEMVELSRRLLHTTSLSAMVGRESEPTLVGYRLAEAGMATLDLLLDSTGEQETVVATLAKGLHSEGTYVVGLDHLSLPPGKYILRLKTPALSMQESLELHRR